MSLSASSSVPWISTSFGPTRNCTTTLDAKSCIPIQFNISSVGLPPGLSTGIVTISDPNAVDAPQTITVTVRVGGIDVYVAPGSSRDVPLTTSNFVSTRTTTQDGGQWLGLSLDGTGSFRFNWTYRVHLAPLATMPIGNYNGSIVTSGSANPTDNQTIPVTMRLTNQPIADASTDHLIVRLAQGAPALTYPFSPIIALNNLGQGTLTGPDPVATGGSWLKFEVKDAYGYHFAIDPAGMPVGTSSGTATFSTNAANTLAPIPIDLQVVAKGAPLIYFQGVQDNATFLPGDTVAQGDIMVVKGEQLSFSAFTPIPTPPLSTQQGGATVLVNGSAVPIFYTSYNQIAFQMPFNTPAGTALVKVQRDDNTVSNTVSVKVAARAPRLLVAVNQDNTVNTPATPAHAGDFLTVYAIGLGPTTPAVAAGVPSPSVAPFPAVTPTPQVAFGSGLFALDSAPVFAGLSPGFVGLYQVNVQIPDGTPKGTVALKVIFTDAVSNVLSLYVQ